MSYYALVAAPFLLSLLVVLLSGGPTVSFLRSKKAQQPISPDAPEKHRLKHGTPTMGGLLIVATTILSTFAGLFWLGGAVKPGSKTLLLAVMACFSLACGIGVLDDLGKARKKENKAGLSEKAKLALQFLVAIGFVFALGLTERAGVTTVLFAFGHAMDLRIAYYGFAVLWIVGFGNAVNFTDGLDGLSSGVTLIVSTTLGALVLPTLSPEFGLFYGALAGACAGFLWFNAYPARVFMGDTGSLALGMGLAAVSLAAKQELLLLVAGGIYLAEIGSMMLQRYVFKYRRIRFGIEFAKANRVFRRAPLHHHFEELGWHEPTVVIRFWTISLAFAAAAILLAQSLSPTLLAPVGALEVGP